MKAESATELLNILDGAVHSPIFKTEHASAACIKLARWRLSTRKCFLVASPSCFVAAPKIRFVIFQKADESAEIVQQSLGCSTIAGCVPRGMKAIVAPFRNKARDMKPQELSNVFGIFWHLRETWEKRLWPPEDYPTSLLVALP